MMMETSESWPVEEILRGLSIQGPLPKQAIEQARLRKEAMTPLLIEALKRYVREDAAREQEDWNVPGIEGMGYLALLAFHLLGEWRTKKAFPAQVHLIEALPEGELDLFFGDFFAEIGYRALAACFDGDVDRLERLILNSRVDEFCRWNLWNSYIMLVCKGEIDRARAEAFSRSCFTRLEQDSAMYGKVGETRLRNWRWKT